MRQIREGSVFSVLNEGKWRENRRKRKKGSLALKKCRHIQDKGGTEAGVQKGSAGTFWVNTLDEERGEGVVNEKRERINCGSCLHRRQIGEEEGGKGRSSSPKRKKAS